MTVSLLRAAQEGDAGAAERVLLENTGLIWSVAKRYFGRGVEPEDLYQLGCIGFVKAVQGYDETFGTQFSTYAVPKIAGEIRRFLRDDSMIKVSRSVKEKSTLLLAVRAKLLQQLGREPALSELAEACDMTVEEIASIELASQPVESLQRESGEEGLTLEGVLGVDGMEDSVLERIAVREAVETLPERERAVILLRYFRGFTQDKAARVLGVSQVQVSRMERRAIQSLQKTMRP